MPQLMRVGGLSVRGGAGNLPALAAAVVKAAGGALYDPSDRSSLFQDASGAIPVAASGDPVRLMRDLSGNGFHAVAPSDAARPTYTVSGSLAYLAVNGTSNWMQIFPTLNLGERWWHVGGWRSDATATAAFGTSSSKTGCALGGGSNTVWCWRDAADAAYSAITPSGISSVHVFTAQQTATNSVAGRLNGVAGTPLAPYDDSGAGQGLALFSRRNSLYDQGLQGRFYGGAWAPGALSASDRALMERFAAQLAGVSL